MAKNRNNNFKNTNKNTSKNNSKNQSKTLLRTPMQRYRTIHQAVAVQRRIMSLDFNNQRSAPLNNHSYYERHWNVADPFLNLLH